VRITETAHLDGADIGLEDSLVRVVQDRNERRVVQHELLDTLVELDSSVNVRRVPGSHEQVVDHGVRVPEEVARAVRVEELEEEVVRIWHVRVPAVHEDGEPPLFEQLRERRTVGEIVELNRDADRSKLPLDLLVLADNVVTLDTRPDRDRAEAAAIGIAGLGEQLASPPRIVRVRGEPGIVALGTRRQDAARKGEPSPIDVLHELLAIDGVDERLAHSTVVEGLDARVKPIKAHADHRPLHVDVAWVGQAAAILAGGYGCILEVALQKLGVHRVKLLAEENSIHESRETRCSAEIVGARAEHDLLAPLPALELERPRADRLGAERVAQLL